MANKDKSNGDDVAMGRLQIRMLEVQQAYHRDRRRAVLVFEGVDAAGKGGAIRRLTERLDPRGVKVWPIGPPDQHDQGHHYLRRFWARLPEPGTIAIFDRSWYGRVLVERVDALAPKPSWKRAYDEINSFERMLTDDGIRLVKLFIDIDRKEQLRRFRERALVPYKRWKVTESDLRMHRNWNAYQHAFKDMLKRCSARAAPWHVVPGNDKAKARLKVLGIVADALARDVELRPPELAPELRKSLEKLLGGRLG
ncbi:MAG: polyphosphate kinase [Alphaproteobacteria bacterium]|nr:polyphosphate kinase [Alphaproteobacteria bacterium]